MTQREMLQVVPHPPSASAKTVSRSGSHATNRLGSRLWDKGVVELGYSAWRASGAIFLSTDDATVLNTAGSAGQTRCSNHGEDTPWRL